MESNRHHGTEENPLISLMRRLKIPVNRETYLSLAYLGNPPEELSPEQEEEMPPHMRHHKGKEAQKRK